MLFFFLCAGAPPSWAGFLPEGAFTNAASGLTAAGFLKLPTSARSAALSGSISHTASDPAGGFAMPSLFNGTEERHQVALASALLPENIVQATAAIGFPIQSRKIVVAVHEILQPALTLYDAHAGRAGEFRPMDTAVMVAWASQQGACPWGVGLGYLNSQIAPGLSGTGVFLNAGGALPFGFFNDPNLSLVGAIINMGPEASWAGKNVPLPLRGQVEMDYKLGTLMTLSLQATAPVDQTPYGAAAIEWTLPFGEAPALNEDPSGGLAIRVGASSRTKTDTFSGRMSFGLGFYLGGLTVDAGFAPFGNLGFFPRLGLTLRL